MFKTDAVKEEKRVHKSYVKINSLKLLHDILKVSWNINKKAGPNFFLKKVGP